MHMVIGGGRCLRRTNRRGAQLGAHHESHSMRPDRVLAANPDRLSGVKDLSGLWRQRQMANITDEEIKMIENKLNNRPRKRLGFRTPTEVFHQSLYRVVLRP